MYTISNYWNDYILGVKDSSNLQGVLELFNNLTLRKIVRRHCK